MPLLRVLAISLVRETLRMVKRRLLPDVILFLTVWLLALLAVIADMLELPGLRPLDWIGFIMQPINKLMP
jgi:hypothetical protein